MPSNGPTTPPLTERYGLFPFQPESAERFIDIVAVHGLGGHYEDTWTWNPPNPNSGTPCNWLKDRLPAQIPDARIMSFGYNSAVALSKSIGDIGTFAEQLLHLVLLERRSERQRRRPIIFVCHTLGGIIVKKVQHFSGLLINLSGVGSSTCSACFVVSTFLLTFIGADVCKRATR